jgi:hypothetical protein
VDVFRDIRRGLGWLIAAISVFPLYAALRTDHRLLGEDPLITLTFAKNLARGDGFVFNHPPPVLGTTTPLFTLLVAAGDRLVPGADPTAIAVWLSAACWVAVLWIFVWFAGDLGLSSWQVLSIAGAVTVTGWVTRLDFEAYLFAALLLLGIALHARGRPVAAGVVAALLFLTRGEGLLLFGVLALATRCPTFATAPHVLPASSPPRTARLAIGLESRCWPGPPTRCRPSAASCRTPSLPRSPRVPPDSGSPSSASSPRSDPGWGDRRPGSGPGAQRRVGAGRGGPGRW